MRDLNRMGHGGAVYADDRLSVQPHHQHPIHLARHRIRVELAQVAHRVRVARIEQEIVERMRLRGLPQRRVLRLVVQCALEFAADVKQFLLGHAPLIDRAKLDRAGSRHANDGNRNQQRQIREAPLRRPRAPLTRPHGYSDSYGRPSKPVPGAPLLTS